MSKKPSSSTSKNFIQMNKAKISSMVSKPRTKSQELPDLSKPAKSSYQSKSKNPGGPSGKSSQSKRLTNPAIKTEELKVSSVIPSSTSFQAVSPVKALNIASPARESVKDSLDDLIESAQSMIDLCEKALTPARMSHAKMSTIEERPDSSAAASPDEVMNLFHPQELDRDPATFPTEENHYSQKTPESKYQESDIHQLIYSVSQSDGSNSKAIQEKHSQDVPVRDTLINTLDKTSSVSMINSAQFESQIKDDHHERFFGKQSNHENDEAKRDQETTESFTKIAESDFLVTADLDSRSSQSSQKKIMTRRASRQGGQELSSQQEKNISEVKKTDSQQHDLIHFHTDDELFYAQSMSDDKKNQEVMSQTSSKSLQHSDLDSTENSLRSSSKKKSASRRSRAGLVPDKIPEAASEDSPLKSSQPEQNKEDLEEDSFQELDEDLMVASPIKTGGQPRKFNSKESRKGENESHQQLVPNPSQGMLEDHVRYHTRKYLRKVADREKNDFSHIANTSNVSSSSSGEIQEEEFSLRRSKRLARKKDEDKKKTEEGQFKRKKSKKHAGHKKKMKY